MDIDKSEVSILEIAATALKALSKEASCNKLSGECGINILKMNEPGTIIWEDPTTKEERYTAPGEMMYSTALMFAKFYIDANGEKQDY